MIRAVVPLAGFVLLLALLATGLGLNPREIPSPLIGKDMPEFSLPSLDSPDGRVASTDFANNVTLLNVWASWCSGCRKEHPLLVEMAKSQQVRLYGLNYKDTRAAASKWLTRHGNPYQATAFDADGRVGIDFGVYGVPETYVIDRHGVVRHKQTGPLTQRVLHDVILPLLEELEHEPA